MSDERYEEDQAPESELAFGILSEEQLEYIHNYIQKEISDTKAEAGREERIERNKTIDRQRQIRPEEETRDFPWDDAANTVPPLLWTKVSTVVSRFVQSILGKDPLFVYTSSDPRYADHAQAITKHIEDIVNDPNQGAFRKSIWPLEFDKASFGTVFVKVPFEIENRYFSRKDPETGKLTKVRQPVRACPKPYVLNFEDFFTRPHWPDIQKAPWIAVRNLKHYHQLKALEAQGVYQNVDLIIDNQSYLDDNKTERMENAGISEQYNSEDPNKIYEIFEVYMYYDVDDSGEAQDLIIHYEPESDTILRVDFNDLGRRDIVRIPYVEIAQVLYGMGVGDMTSNLQEMIETVFNTSFNSDELSYMGMLLTRQGSGLEYGKDAYPGAILELPDPERDLKVLSFPSATMQSMAVEQKIQAYADQATGSTQMMSGAQPKGEGNRIGSTGTQFLAAAGNAYLQAFLELAVNGYQEIGELMLTQLVRNYQLIDYDNMPESMEQLLKEVYSTPVEQIHNKFRFSVSMADIQQESRERQQVLVTLFELYGAFMDRITQYASVMSNPQLSQPGFERMQEVMMTAYVGMNKLFERLLENFNEKEIADFMPFYRDMEYVLENLDKEKEAAVERFKVESNTGATADVGQRGVDTAGPGEPQIVESGYEEGIEEGAGASAYAGAGESQVGG